MRLKIATAAFATLLLVTEACGADLRTIIQFERQLGQFPEGIAVEAGGDLLVGFAPLSTIARFAPDGSFKGTVAQWPPGDHQIRGLPGLLGLEIDTTGRMFAAIVSCFPALESSCADTTHGVWHANADGGPIRVPGTENISWPNAIAAYKTMTLFISDTLAGMVWRAQQKDGQWSVEPWSVDPLLAGDGRLAALTGAPMLGANGIVTSKGAVWVANTELGNVIRIPVREDGSAGTPAAAFGPDDLCLPLPPSVAPCALDGLGADVFGRLYVVVIGQNRLVRADPASGEVVELSNPGEGLQFPASLSFGRSESGRKTLYATNFAALSPAATPGIVALDIDAPGQPLAGVP